MQTNFKVFHFQELDWLLLFPAEGNKGKYCNYSVLFKERKKERSKQVILGHILERAEIENRYPHTVGFFKAHDEWDMRPEMGYMEIRTIHNVDELWLFLNALNL